MFNPRSNPVGEAVGHDEEAEEREEQRRFRQRLLLNRPKFVPISEEELMEILRTLPRRRARLDE